MRPALSALLIQASAAAVAGVVIHLLRGPPACWLLLTPTLAFLLAWRTRQAVWWRVIHIGFMPAVAGALWLGVAPEWYLLAFLLAWALFGRIDKSRVPLYLSNRQALAALEPLLPQGAKVLDAGSGTGSVLAYLSRRPDLQLTGVEHAWLPWLLAWLRLYAQRSPAQVLRADVLRMSLAGFDVVYAFLSPAMMPALWEKARSEMQRGSLLISNSFEIPGVPADKIIELHDWKGARLYLWQMP